MYETHEGTCSLLLEAKLTFITLQTEGNYLTDNISFSICIQQLWTNKQKAILVENHVLCGKL